MGYGRPHGTRDPTFSHALLLAGVRDLSVAGGREVGDGPGRADLTVIAARTMCSCRRSCPRSPTPPRRPTAHDHVAIGASAHGLVEHPLLGNEVMLCLLHGQADMER